MILVLTDPGGEPLDLILDRNQEQPLDLARVLRIAIGLAKALGQVHRHGLAHKDIRPLERARRRRRQRLVHRLRECVPTAARVSGTAPPEIIAGTLAYMSPEQTGRMNRSIDTRSDVYSLGVTLYQMLTGIGAAAREDCSLRKNRTADVGTE